MSVVITLKLTKRGIQPFWLQEFGSISLRNPWFLEDFVMVTRVRAETWRIRPKSSAIKVCTED